MKKLKVYLDTSVINFIYANDAPDFRNITITFFNEYINDFQTFISEIVLLEIQKTKDHEKRNQLLNVIKDYPINLLEINNNEEIKMLADMYIKEKIIPEKKYEDALHIAIASFYEIDILLSWNFKHLANIKKQIAINATNEKQGYLKKINLVSPLEVIYERE